ncbi:MAG: acetyl-CoA carboxylase biotin carboxylase subunit [Streptosporangiales bacterium]|nr:acetyl-CoA carboxylase biotin carboxylase subunit [Streptosporangiales bacterium]
MTGLNKVFVANRGEIAVRVIDACDRLGIETVLGVSAADRDTLGARRAGRAFCIGPAAATGSYLNPQAIVAAALGTGCDAVHPGYGFLAERAAFQRLCTEHGLVFVGPSADAIEAMGDKLHSRALAAEAGVPVLTGSVSVRSAAHATELAADVGYPFLFKASAGGGGRGMRVVAEPDQVARAYDSATAEAEKAFGDGTAYLERYLDRARHVEIQVLGDGSGKAIHLGERECSVQRRHQKLVEEAPSPIVDAATRAAMADAAVNLAAHVHYLGAGTVEFVVDERSGEFFFLEMNTRIQVEHPVTEMVTGVDLVAEQLKLAAGEPLLPQEDVTTTGHAIEFRVNAEDPARGFLPAPGTLDRWSPPAGTGIRVDTHCYPGYTVPPYYDSLLAKLIVHGPDRATAIDRAAAALDDFTVDGVRTTLPFHQALLTEPAFLDDGVHTGWVDENADKWSALV